MVVMMFLLFFIGGDIFQVSGQKSEPIEIKQVEVNQYSLELVDPLFIDEQKLELLMDNLEERIYQAPKNAKIAKSGEIVPEELGVTLDREKFLVLFREHYYSEKNKNFEVPTKAVYPKVDRGLLKDISTKQVGAYNTFFRPSNKERSHNIKLAANGIDNTVIFPGETFSFNQVVGERTKEKGYKRAPVIVKGELAEDIGGGICQVSSTLYNAVDFPGIQIVERYAHSKRVPYVPPGRDATVSWWGPDFVFKNMLNEPVLIRAQAENGRMSVQVYTSETAEYFKGE